VFFGPERYDHQRVHPHESPFVMTGPLVVLAFLSVVGGVIGLPAVLHVPHLLDRWLEPVVAPGREILALRGEHALSHTLEWILLLGGAAIALFFAHQGFHAYRHGVARDEEFARRFPARARFLGRAWTVDELYTGYIVQPIKLIAFVIAVVLDQFAIDGIVNGTASLARGGGERLRRMTDGRIKTYALWIGAGAIVIAALWMWR
jgi:NADH-quinone oxidoreductase subunit L